VTGIGSSPLLLLLDDLEINSIPDPKWLIEGIIPEGGFAQLFGPKGCGKTFVSLDIALSIASGEPWGGLKVLGGPVVYIYAEGTRGIKKRVNAWKARHGFDPSSPIKHRVYFIPVPVQLLRDDQVALLIRTVQERVPENPVLVIFDTQARCTLGGDENLAKDMGFLVNACDKVRQALGATILLIHHTGHKKNHGRGSTAVPGALDTVMRLEKGKTLLTLHCDNQKDAEEFKPLSIRLEPYCDSLVARVVGRGASDQGESGLSEKGEQALRTLGDFKDEGVQHKDWMARSGLARETFNRVLKTLRAEDFITQEGRLYFLSDTGQRLLGPSPNTVPRESHGTALDVSPNGPTPPKGGDGGTSKWDEGELE